MKKPCFLCFFVGVSVALACLGGFFVNSVSAETRWIMTEADREQIPWRKTSLFVTRTLLCEEKNRSAWEAELVAKTEKNAEEWLTLANLALRNAHDEQFLDAILNYARCEPKRETVHYVLDEVHNDVVTERGNHVLTRKLGETFASEFAPRARHDVGDFFKYGEDPEVELKWYEERYLTWKRVHPDENIWNNPWMTWRLGALKNAKKLDILHEEVRAVVMNSENTPKVRVETLAVYLSLLNSHHLWDYKPKLDWVVSCPTMGSYQAIEIAETLFYLKKYELAKVFALRALETPVPEDETDSRRCEYQTRLYRCLERIAQKLGEAEDAEKWKLTAEKSYQKWENLKLHDVEEEGENDTEKEPKKPKKTEEPEKTKEPKKTEKTEKLVKTWLKRDEGFDLDSDVMWDWLAEREKWNSEDILLLERIFEVVQAQISTGERPETDAEVYYTRADKLATTPWRACVLGEALYNVNLLERSIPFWVRGARSEYQKERQWATLRHLETLFELRRWAEAEKLFWDNCENLTEDGLIQYMTWILQGAEEDNVTDVVNRCRKRIENVEWIKEKE
ncbi:MAG: hypothetical protein Q4C70_06495 [Planctomycetia bacterium]|nr:hypothetical protein [Planctomycetia bacterium]